MSVILPAGCHTRGMAEVELAKVGAIGPDLELLAALSHIPGARPAQLGWLALSQGPRIMRVTPEWIRQTLQKKARSLSGHERSRVAEVLCAAETERGLDALLLLALIDQESSYKPRAKGPRGSLGLMQIRPFVGRDVAKRAGIRWRGPSTLFDPAQNVRIGIRYFAELKTMYPDDELALVAYNMGPYRLKGMLARGREPRRSYARGVLARYEELRRGFAEVRERRRF